MKTSDLYLNSTAMLQDLQVRGKLTSLVEDASADQLQALVYIATGQHWHQERVEEDLGSSAIEFVLDHIEHADRGELQRIRQVLEIQGVSL